MTLSFLPFSLLKPLNTFFLHTLCQLMMWLPISIGVGGGDGHSTRRECPISHWCWAPQPNPINAVHPLPFSHIQGCHASISLFFSALSVIPSPLDCCHQEANMLLILPFKKIPNFQFSLSPPFAYPLLFKTTAYISFYLFPPICYEKFHTYKNSEKVI